MRPLEAPARLRAQQLEFAAHLRDPARNPAPPDLEDRRMAIYRDLFFNSLESLLSSGFPVIRTLRGDAWWRGLVRDFYREHCAHTPLFPEVAREFIRYLEARQQRETDDPPFLLELAHYEWIELALGLEDETSIPDDVDAAGDLLDGVPVPSPFAWPLAYQYPVHQIRTELQPDAPPAQPTFLLVLRTAALEIRFKEIDLLGFRLLQAINDNDAGATGREILAALAAEAGLADPADFITNGGGLLRQLHEREAILGTRNTMNVGRDTAP